MIFELTQDDLARLFPAFLVVDRQLKLCAFGPAIRQHCRSVCVGDLLDSHFLRVASPAEMAIDAAAEHGTSILLRSRTADLELSGNVIPQGDLRLLALNLIPSSSSFESNVLQISDFGPSDPIVRGLLLVSLQKAMLEEARTNAIDLAEQRQHTLDLLDRISRVAGYLAHDFNNFLSIIRLNGDRLLGSGLTEHQSRLVRIILETCERGTGITRSLKTLSHQESETRSRINLDHLLADHHAFFSTVAGSSIRTSLRLNAPDMMVEVARTGMLNCMMNLIINARDAMPDGGEITISTAIRTAQPLASLASDAQSYVAIEVADTGGGMPQDVLGHAFDQFFSTKEHGSGLGLASVMEFSQEMGGAACLDSPDGEGAKVYIYLPICAFEDLGRQLPASPKRTSEVRRSIKILVVEDEPYALEALVEMLESDGYQVFPSRSAEQAITMLAQDPHDILLADVVMPNMTGMELAAWVNDKFPKLKVVMMSGYVPDDQEMSEDWYFIRKPLDINHLRKILHAIVCEMKPKAMMSSVQLP